MGNFTNLTSLEGFVAAANTASSGYLAYSALFIVPIALFFAALPYGRSKAAAVASFMGAITAMLLDNMGLFGAQSIWWVIVGFLLIFGVSVAMIQANKRRI